MSLIILLYHHINKQQFCDSPHSVDLIKGHLTNDFKQCNISPQCK